MTIEKDQFYGTLNQMKEASCESVEAHMPTFDKEFGQSLGEAQQKYEVTKQTDQAIVSCEGVLEIMRTADDVSDKVRYTIAHLFNVFLNREPWIQGTKIDVFMSGMVQQFGEEAQRIHKELSKREHADILKPSFPPDRN